ncbi:hypothetical protein BGZ70_010502 [Mortierella alpina]|uniref:Uncharacterized protein n=1 Tax=Mortierella alpina TaxID=64518 RepID=A0A9P6LZ76_MORAP|nr:hypothetical protein BGZ70_010502 [Mortierella alpina]
MSEVSDISTRRLQNVKQSKLLQCPYELLMLIIAYFRKIVELKHFTHTCSMLLHVVDDKNWFKLYRLQHPMSPKRFDYLKPYYTDDYWKRTSLKRHGCDHHFKVVLTGDIGVGKTDLVSRFVKNELCHKYKSTFEVDLIVKCISIRSKTIKVEIWDVDRRLMEIDNHVKSNIPIMLVGNKSDKSQWRAVSTDDGMRFAAENDLSFIEASASDSSNVELLFQRFLTEVYMANTFPYKA